MDKSVMGLHKSNHIKGWYHLFMVKLGMIYGIVWPPLLLNLLWKHQDFRAISDLFRSCEAGQHLEQTELKALGLT
jgi:hypothetical protein